MTSLFNTYISNIDVALLKSNNISSRFRNMINKYLKLFHLAVIVVKCPKSINLSNSSTERRNVSIRQNMNKEIDDLIDDCICFLLHLMNMRIRILFH